MWRTTTRAGWASRDGNGSAPAARLAEIRRENAFLLSELEEIQAGLRSPRNEPRTSRLRARRSGMLALLRANRLESRVLLARTAQLVIDHSCPEEQNASESPNTLGTITKKGEEPWSARSLGAAGPD
jgi:hypothetical protein